MRPCASRIMPRRVPRLAGREAVASLAQGCGPAPPCRLQGVCVLGGREAEGGGGGAA